MAFRVEAKHWPKSLVSLRWLAQPCCQANSGPFLSFYRRNIATIVLERNVNSYTSLQTANESLPWIMPPLRSLANPQSSFAGAQSGGVRCPDNAQVTAMQPNLLKCKRAAC